MHHRLLMRGEVLTWGKNLLQVVVVVVVVVVGCV
jgi:hypothetical protein